MKKGGGGWYNSYTCMGEPPPGNDRIERKWDLRWKAEVVTGIQIAAAVTDDGRWSAGRFSAGPRFAAGMVDSGPEGPGSCLCAATGLERT